MDNLKEKTLALFFTNGVSLQTWERVGNLQRELLRYREFAKHFKKIYFFTYGDKRDLDYKKLLPDNIIVLPKKYQINSKIYGFLLPFFYRKELKGVSFLKTNQMNGSWSAIITKKMYGGKLIIRCGLEWLRFSEFKKRNWIMLRVISLIEKIAYNLADLVILPTEEDKKFVVSTFNISKEKIKILPNHIDTDFFKPLSTSKEKNSIIAVARLEKQKNIVSLIQAVSYMDTVKLIILGDGSQRKELENFAKEKGANVEFKGNIPQERLPKELNKSELFVLPSLYEGSPKALLEAMAMGLPCIGTNVAGIKDVLVHKENGYLCNIDANSICEAIKNLMADKKLQIIIGQNARKTIEDKFSFKKICEEELSYYLELAISNQSSL